VVAVRVGQQVTRQLHVVTSGLLISQSRLVGDADPDLSKLLAVAAWRINPSSAARSAMLAAAARPGIAIFGGYTDAVLSVAFSPDGKTLAGGSNDDTVAQYVPNVAYQRVCP
jgi:WD40 repeat protein